MRGDRRLFSGLNFSPSPGTFLQLTGPGSGKTSLLRILCGLLTPAEGQVSWEGTDIRSLGEDYFTSVTYLGHRAGVKDELSPLENLRISNALNGVEIDRDRARSVLEQMGLGRDESLPARLLSEGQRRRVALARLAVCCNSQFLDRWLRVVITPNRSAKALEGYQWHVKHLKGGLGSIKLVDLRPQRIQAFYAALTPSTAQHCHSALRAALNIACKWELIRKNPALKVEPPKHTAREIPFLTAEEIARLLASTSGQYHALFSFMVASGVRPGETFALRWSDLDGGMTTATIQRSVSWREKRDKEKGGYQYKVGSPYKGSQ